MSKFQKFSVYMGLFFYVALGGILFTRIHVKDRDDPLRRMNAVELIRYYGYGAEEHNVTTDDGYILTIQRIIPRKLRPGGAEDMKDREKKQGPVLIMHGMACTSTMWLLQGPDADLAFMLADEGFDVWLGNFRGNSYSSVSESAAISPTDFSYHEMGQLDLPAMVDYVRGTTGYEQVGLVGHSMGTTSILAGLSTVPGLNEKLSHVALIAPFITLQDSDYFGPQFVRIAWLVFGPKGMGIADDYHLTKMGPLMSWLISNVPVPCKFIFELFSSLVNGRHSNCDISIPAEVLTAHLMGAHTEQTLAHMHYNSLSGQFRMRPLGDLNAKVYNATDPPLYKLHTITVPLSAHLGAADGLTPPQDFIERLGLFNVPIQMNRYEGFNHVDMIWSEQAHSTVFPTIISNLKTSV